MKEMKTVIGCLLLLAGCTKPVSSSLNEQTWVNGPECDFTPTVKIEGTVYYDTGYRSTEARCGVMDGEITSAVEHNELPTLNDQSNFGSGYGYQYGTEGSIEILIDGQWLRFAKQETPEDPNAEKSAAWYAEICREFAEENWPNPSDNWKWDFEHAVFEVREDLPGSYYVITEGSFESPYIYLSVSAGINEQVFYLTEDGQLIGAGWVD